MIPDDDTLTGLWLLLKRRYNEDAAQYSVMKVIEHQNRLMDSEALRRFAMRTAKRYAMSLDKMGVRSQSRGRANEQPLDSGVPQVACREPLPDRWAIARQELRRVPVEWVMEKWESESNGGRPRKRRTTRDARPAGEAQ